MTAADRREQLIEVAGGLVAERGFAGSAIEEVANRAAVSKPVVYVALGRRGGPGDRPAGVPALLTLG